jgi:alkaline phosphatase D
MIVNPDQWHGYPSARQRLLQFLRGSAGGPATVGNVVVLTGDIHSSWANELVFDPLDPASYNPTTGVGAVAVELVTPGITSPGLPPLFLPAVESARPYNPHLRWFDLMRQGYMILDLSPERAEAAWYLYADIKQATPVNETFAAVWSASSRGPRRRPRRPARRSRPEAARQPFRRLTRAQRRPSLIR